VRTSRLSNNTPSATITPISVSRMTGNTPSTVIERFMAGMAEAIAAHRETLEAGRA
jgi:hypothetical protein